MIMMDDSNDKDGLSNDSEKGDDYMNESE
jgi:hypothetical protein